MKRLLAALGAGFVFAIGLGLSGMTLPSKIVGFLDVFGHWDPTLLLVMVGAVGVHMLTRRWVLQRKRPLLETRFVLPTKTQIDRPLVLGAALFGAGWGLAGYCPGPSLASLGSTSGATWLFVAGMVAGMWIFAAYERAKNRAGVPRAIRNAPEHGEAASS